MNFSEFLREEEELDLFYEAIVEEGLLGGVARAVGGSVGNLIGQTARGVGNIASGAGRAVKGVGKVGLGAVQGLTGGGGKAISSIGGGVGDIASGVGSALTGVAQAAGAVSGFTPMLRGVQAATEKGVSPMSNRRTGIQRAMGLNSWTPEEDARKDSEERFEDLKRQYSLAQRAGDFNRKRRIRAEMEKLDPKAYKALVAKSAAMKSARDRARWSRIEVPSTEGPEDYLGRLASEN